MAEFLFDVTSIFPDRITKIGPELVPGHLARTRRRQWEVTSMLTQVLDELGRLSAAAQQLKFPITNADRLRQSSDHLVYVLTDSVTHRNGLVCGFLKVGFKNLYLFDNYGRTRQVEHAPSILDFYVHERLQRRGHGKELFDFMLKDLKIPVRKFCIDGPSDKMLGFLRKNYNLNEPIPQSNNFVLYQGFFDDDIAPVPNTFRPTGRLCPSLAFRRPNETHLAPIGRFGARRGQDRRTSIY